MMSLYMYPSETYKIFLCLRLEHTIRQSLPEFIIDFEINKKTTNHISQQFSRSTM